MASVFHLKVKLSAIFNQCDTQGSTESNRHPPLLANVEVRNVLVRSLDRHEDHRAADTVQKHDNK